MQKISEETEYLALTVRVAVLNRIKAGTNGDLLAVQ